MVPHHQNAKIAFVISKPSGKQVEPAHSLFGRERYPLDVFFKPESVAVIGATEAEGSVGRSTLWNLISSPFGGTVYPVNPKRSRVLGMRTYPAVRDVPDGVQLAIVVTPAATVPGVIAECVAAGVRGAIILSAGFREVGAHGASLEREAMEEARKGSLRVIGPNSLGVMCPSTNLNATFAQGMARAGSVAFLSQSGALGTAVLDWADREQVGFSTFVSLGSMPDVGWGDLIDYLGNDSRTRSILIYMESIGDAGAFLSAAREVAMTKPILVIKAGRTPEGARAAAAHTGAQSGNDEVLDAALRRCGVLRVNSIADLFYMAEVLGKQPRPRGKRLTIVTNAGGPAVLAADSVILNGGDLAPLSLETIDALHAVLPPEWSRGNPIDVLGDATPERYAKAMEIVSKDATSDGFLVVLAPQAMTDPVQIADHLKAYGKLNGKPVLASWMGGSLVSPGIAILQSAGIPNLSYPDTAARLFCYMWSYSENLRSIYETPLAEPLTEERCEPRVSPGNPEALLAAYDIAVPPEARITIGSFADDQFGPVVFIEDEFGGRGVGLPTLTTTLAGLMLRSLRVYATLDQPLWERLLVRLSRMVAEHPRIRRIAVGPFGVTAETHPADIPPDLLPRPAIRPYPVEYVAPWTLKGGLPVLIRPIRPEDEPLVARFHETLSERTVYFRYLSALKLSTRIAHERLIRICFIDYARQMALVAEHENPETGESEILAIGRLHKDWQAFARGVREAEFALVVSDRFQGQGLGKELLRRLIAVARQEDVDTLFGEISAENMSMQAICRWMGFQIRRDYEDTTVVARLKIER